MSKLSILVILAAVAIANGHVLVFVNNCDHPVWMGLLNNPGKGLPLDGGFKLESKKQREVTVAWDWAGRFWARTNCNAEGHCATGDCGNKIKCGGAGGQPPVSLAEITFEGWGHQDYYDVSLVDGYNLPISMEPVSGFIGKDGSKYRCTWAGCNRDLNAICPQELRKTNANGKTIACLSACMKFNTDQYCCRGAHNTPETCKSSNWPVNYPKVFKQACPEAYSYAYDDTSSTFTCESTTKGSSKYRIKICP